MQQTSIELIQSSAEYKVLVSSRRRFSFTLTALMVFTFYGFILFVAFAPRTLARPLYEGATTSVGIAAGVGIMLIGFGLTAWYVRRSNVTFDPLMSTMLAKAQQGD
ncbi:DUF485 domain-containing protein [Paraburkholderia sp. UYCP14C]|uniref:DUF485 domain-containing protein n=1 Tax=Paraburkholderia sp. UYCP14C TaxID=2511130 RepID=UPI00102234C1|nr:DUF485 domain-containing protein [Paraburkholderia sp. UYCP14C]RZF26742.1 DUF485 domain-containing protein [Paraburkholderia sp. UYCP14C]